MPWFIDKPEIERRGALEVLNSCGQFPPVRKVIQLLRDGTDITAASIALRRELSALVEQLDQFESKLASLRSDLKMEQEVVAMYRRDLGPNYDRIKQLESDLAEWSRTADNERTVAAELRFTLERNNRLHDERVEALEERIRELNELVAEQHSQLESIVGSSRPPEETA